MGLYDIIKGMGSEMTGIAPSQRLMGQITGETKPEAGFGLNMDTVNWIADLINNTVGVASPAYGAAKMAPGLGRVLVEEAKKVPMRLADQTGAIDVFHGSKNKFTDFNVDKVDPTDSVLDRFIGSHFAADEEVAKYHAGGNPEGIKKIRLDVENPYVLNQIKNGGSDQWAFQVDIAKTVFPARKDLFVEYWSKARAMPKSEVANIYDDIKAGKIITNNRLTPVKGVENQFEGIAENYGMLVNDEKLKKEIINEYRKQISEKGFDSIKYQNTGVSETANAKDKTSYVVFDKGRIKIK
jgi:hypothetical protein